MNKTIVTLAALLGVIAVSALVLSVRPHVSVDSAIGYASVLALAGVAGLEYRINWKRVLSW